MWQQVVDRPDRSAAIGRALADVQLALFELVTPVTLPDQRDRLSSKIRWSAANMDASLAAALDLLPGRASTPRLCHGDLHPSNVIMGQDGPVLVDWFDACRGDRVADIARSSLTLLAHGATTPSHLPGSDPGTLAVLTRAYLSRLKESLDIPQPCSPAGRRSTRRPAWPRACRASRCSRSGGGSSGQRASATRSAAAAG